MKNLAAKIIYEVKDAFRIFIEEMQAENNIMEDRNRQATEDLIKNLAKDGDSSASRQSRPSDYTNADR